LRDEGRGLYDIVKRFGGHKDGSATDPGRLTNEDVSMEEEIEMDKKALNEICPACGEEIALINITSGVCGRGHVWGELIYARSIFAGL
jgi:hypothetical protein